MASFVGRKGVFMVGEVKPPLEGVTITVTSEDGAMEPVVLVTEANGKYRWGKCDVEEGVGQVKSKNFNHPSQGSST